MAQYNFDLSEYQRSEHARRLSVWEGCDDLSPDFHENTVSYFPDTKNYVLLFPPFMSLALYSDSATI